MPYARALHALARERNQVDVVGRELASLAELLEQAPEVNTFFAQPWVPAPAKRAVALELASRLDVSALTRDFLRLVAPRGRANHFQNMAGTCKDRGASGAGRE